MTWAIDFEGETYAEVDLTLLDASKVIGLTGGTWTELHPLTSPSHLATILAVFLEKNGESFTDALLRTSALKMTEALGYVKAV